MNDFTKPQAQSQSMTPVLSALAATGDFLKPSKTHEFPYIRKVRKQYINMGHPGTRNPKIITNVTMMYEKWRTQYPEGTLAIHKKFHPIPDPRSSGEKNLMLIDDPLREAGMDVIHDQISKGPSKEAQEILLKRSEEKSCKA